MRSGSATASSARPHSSVRSGYDLDTHDLNGWGNCPTQVTDLELDKGLLHLVNRGLLPGKVDLTPALCGEAGEGGRRRRQGTRDAGGPVREVSAPGKGACRAVSLVGRGPMRGPMATRMPGQDVRKHKRAIAESLLLCEAGRLANCSMPPTNLGGRYPQLPPAVRPSDNPPAPPLPCLLPPGPYRAGAVSLHPHQQQFTPGPVTSALEDALTRRQDFKLDLVTPVVRPQQENKQVGCSVTKCLAAPGAAIEGAPTAREATWRLRSFGTAHRAGLPLRQLFAHRLGGPRRAVCTWPRSCTPHPALP